MIEFTFWDIVRNLLLAARWTVLLSIVAFVGGGAGRAADPVPADLEREMRSGASAAATSACSRARRC